MTPTVGTWLRLVISPAASQLQFVPSLVVGSALLAYLALRRPVVEWRTVTGPLLLLSVPTAAYGWSFDHVVLLVPYLTIVSWVRLRRSRMHAFLVLSSLAFIAVLMLTQNLLKLTSHRYFWVPWLLAAVYLYARATCIPTSGGLCKNGERV